MKNILIIVKNNAHLCGLDEDVCQYVKNFLTISNPLFEKKIELGLPSWGTPNNLKYYEIKDNTIIVPIGALPEVINILEHHNIKVNKNDIKDRRFDKKLPKYFEDITFKATLRNYQKEMVDATKNRTVGVIEAMTGAGKTVFALGKILESKRPTLFLVHTLELANQSIESFCKFTNLKKEDIGFIGNGKFELKPITVGLHQTLAKLPKFKFDIINQHISQVIGDEIHIIAAETWYRTMCSLDAKFKWGISATPKRTDGLTKVIHWATGPKIYTVDEKELVNVLIKPTIEYLETGYSFPIISTQEYQEMITDLAEDTDRNKLILDTQKKYPKKYSIMLCERISQVTYLHKEIKNSVMLTSKMTKKDREKTMESVKTGKKNVVISTYGLFSTGIDIPALELLFLCSPIKSEIRLRQSAGRLMRKSPGKTEAKIIDFVDKKVGILFNAAKKRRGILNRL